MRRLSLAAALAGMLALGAFETTAFAADVGVSDARRGRIAAHHWRGTRRAAVQRCVEVSQPARGCPLRQQAWAWPGIPRCHLYGDVCLYYTAPDLEQWGHWGD